MQSHLYRKEVKLKRYTLQIVLSARSEAEAIRSSRKLQNTKPRRGGVLLYFIELRYFLRIEAYTSGSIGSFAMLEEGSSCSPDGKIFLFQIGIPKNVGTEKFRKSHSESVAQHFYRGNTGINALSV